MVANVYEILQTLTIVTILAIGIKFFQKLWNKFAKQVRINRALGKFPTIESTGDWTSGTNVENSEGILNSVFLQSLLYRTRVASRAYRIWDGPFTSCLVLVHPDVIKPVLKSSLHKPAIYDALRSFQGRGINTVSAHEWYIRRHLMNPAFNSQSLKANINLFNDKIDLFVEKINAFAVNAEPTFIHEDLHYLALDMTLGALFPYMTDCYSSGLLREIKATTEELGVLWSKRVSYFLYMYFPFTYWFSCEGRRVKCLANKLNEIAAKVIDNHKRAMQDNSAGGQSSNRLYFLDFLLLKAKNGDRSLSKTDVQSELNFILQTSATPGIASMWALYLLAKHQDIQQDVQKEIDKLIEDHGSERSCLQKLPALRRCVKETLRIYPTGAYISRYLEHDIELDGKNVPAGTTLNVPIWSLHHNPTVWGEDHMEFKPDRFTEEEIAKRDPFSYQPFTAGPRNCIGQGLAKMEMTLILARLLHRYNFSLVDRCPIPQPLLTISLIPEKNVPLNITLRT